MRRRRLITVGVALIALVAGLAAYQYVDGKRARVAASTDSMPSSEAFFRTNLRDLQGINQPMSQYRGKVVVVNFWAPWCPPCREEMPGFVALQNKYKDKNVVFVGIALDEKEKVQAFADEIGVNYPLLLGQLDAAQLAEQLGNRLGGLPYTVVIDRAGRIDLSAVGGLNQGKLESVLLRLI